MALTRKKIPQRMCIVCGEQKDKKSLLRIVRNGEEIHADPTGRLNGRGAYLCEKPECRQNLKKKRSLDRAFSTHVDDAVYETLEKELSDYFG